MGRARVVEKDEQAKRAVIQLPQPELLQARIDHSRTKTWEVKRTTWLPWAGDQDKLRDYVMGEAQKLVAFAAGSDENLAQARSCAEAAIYGFFAELDWEVTVQWEKGK